MTVNRGTADARETLRAAVAERLGEVWGGAVALAPAEADNDAVSGRGHVLRFSLARAPTGSPASVVVKLPRPQNEGAEGERPFDPGGDDPATIMFFNEWASLRLITEVCEEANDQPPAPRFLCGSRERGFIVMEDLGAGERLDHALLGGDAAEATRTLVGLFAAVGRMHALTTGCRARFDAILAGLGRRSGPPFDPELSRRRRAAYEDALARLEVEPAPGFVEQMLALREGQDRPGDFDVLVHGDPCPDNCHRAGESVRLVDFEHGRFGDAFTDGCYPRVPFPTCWCVGRLPPDAVERAVHAYRGELVKGAPMATDESRFERGMLEASIRWVWGTLVHWHMPGVLEEDSDWGLATLRQRLLLRFRLLLERLEHSALFPAVTETTRRTLNAFTTRWPEVPEMSSYAAFR
jgi:Phosphotransferase enzyme family